MTDIELKHWFASDEFNRQYFYKENDLGANYASDHTTFKVWAPTAETVGLNLYKDGRSGEAIGHFQMKKREKGVWELDLDGDREGVYYTYSVTVDGKTRETGDPYAKACGVNGFRSMVVDLQKTDPEGWTSDKRPAGITKHPVIWELHIKDFSNDWRGDVRAEWRGKYMAFTEQDTSLEGKGEYPTCMAYLKQLGVTYVHLMPAYDYGSVDEEHPEWNQFNWGYDPVNYNVPEGSYSTNPLDGHVRIREFKEMVMALHKAGIGVIMDVVYNHTYDMDSVFQKTVPGYFYRMYEDGTWANGSGCGNDTASERAMFGKYMADSVCYWAKEYHIDGFRFDLMGLHDVNTMNMIRKRLDRLPGGKNILMYGEPWSASGTAWENMAYPANMDNLQLLDERIAVFCDKTRDALKGSPFEAIETGYVSGDSKVTMSLKRDIEAAVCAWCGPGRDSGRLNPKSPRQIVSYVSAHDDRSLWDKLVVSVKEVPEYEARYEDILQMNRMAAGIVLTCLGMPFIMAGEEFGRTRLGCSNSYNQPAWLNELDWKRSGDYRELVDYYRFLIALRRELPLLEKGSNEAAEAVRFLEIADAVIGFVLDDAPSGRRWQRAVVYYNPYNCRKKITLPEGQWRLLSDGVNHQHKKGVAVKGSRIILKAKSVTILGER